MASKPKFRDRIVFDADVGGAAWREAVAYYTAAEEHLSELSPDQCATSKVVSIRGVRSSSAGERAHRVESLRRCSERLLRAPAPNPLELAKKIQLVAYLEGLSDPAYFTDGDFERGTSLERAFGCLGMDALRLHGFHDAGRRDGARKNRAVA